jgi:hypothetical protein
MVIGPRVGVQILVGAFLSWSLTGWFVSIGWLKEGEPFRKITFLIALGTILARRSWTSRSSSSRRGGGWKESAAAPGARGGLEAGRHEKLVAWIIAWGIGIILTGHVVLGQPVGFLVVARVAGVRLLPGERHLARAHRQQPDFVRIRGDRAHHGHARR